MTVQIVGFDSAEMRTDEPTRSARLKWVIVVDDSLQSGRVVNAVACVAAATGGAVAGLLARGGPDADAIPHHGLPWAGCTVLAADTDKLRQVHRKAMSRGDIFIADMPTIAQETRVYDEFLDRLSNLRSSEINYSAVSLVGPRKSVDRVIGGLGLLQ